MPFVRITVREDTPRDTQLAIADGVHRALVSAIGIPAADRFQVIDTRPAHAVVFDPSYLGVDRQNVVYLEISLARGRSVELKQALYKTIAANLAEAGVRPADVVVVLSEVGREDFSMGEGAAQLLDTELMRSHGWTPPSG